MLEKRRFESVTLMEKKIKHRAVKFSPEEMAYDAPPDTDFSRWKPLGRGVHAIVARPPKLRTMDIEPDVAKVFKTSQAVNQALRMLIDTAAKAAGAKRKIA